MTRYKLSFLIACAVLSYTARAADPQQADVLIAQGNQLDDQGDHDGAIVAYGKAIDLGDEFIARLDRSVAYAHSGHYTEAFQDLDRAQALKPSDASPLSARYWFDFELYQYPAVIATIDKMNGLTPADPYAPLLRFIASSRLGQNTNAQLQKSLTPENENQWPYAAVQMFLGKVTPDQLLQRVEDTGNQQAACEAPFYVGEYFLIHHNNTLAQTAFAETERDECRPLMEYYAAHDELSSINSAAQ